MKSTSVGGLAKEEKFRQEESQDIQRKPEGKAEASREKQHQNVTQDVSRMLHQVQGTNIGAGSVARTGRWSSGECPGEGAKGRKEDKRLARPGVRGQTDSYRYISPKAVFKRRASTSCRVDNYF